MAAIGRSISIRAFRTGSFADLFCFVTACGSGCTWERSWEGKRNMPLQPGTPVYLANSLQRWPLDLKPTGEYELHASGVPTRGLYPLSGKSGSLKPVTMMDRPTRDAKPI